jgi:hypothetical protein
LLSDVIDVLAQPAQEGEVAGIAHVDELDLWHFYPLQETVNFPAGTKFYTTPPAAQPAQEPSQASYPEYDRGFSEGWDRCKAAAQRPWVGLTDEERAECWSSSAKQSAINIEAKLKEKNFD